MQHNYCWAALTPTVTAWVSIFPATAARHGRSPACRRFIRGGCGPPRADQRFVYDRKGAAYIAGLYCPSEGRGSFVAFQKSTNGTHWSKPTVALRAPGASPMDTGLTVDTNVGSHWVNSLYVSGIMELAHGNTQVLVAHSNDGGVT